MFATDLRHTPFSHRGSYLKLAPRVQGDLALQTSQLDARTLRETPPDEWAHDLFSLGLSRGDVPVPADRRSTPVELSLDARDASGSVRVTFLDADTLLLEGTGGISLRLRALQTLGWVWERAAGEVIGAFRSAPLQWRVRGAPETTVRRCETRAATNPAEGLRAAVELVISNPSRWQATIHVSETLPDAAAAAVPTFDAILAGRTRELTNWLARTPPVAPAYTETAQRAWHVFYNVEVPSTGRFHPRRPLLSSKDYLNQIWSWDMCFHALALARADLTLAWGQILLMFDRQAANGQLPDTVNAGGATYTFVKPPVIGWTVQRLIARHGWEANEPFLREIHEPLAALTRWWYSARDPAGAATPVYLHGNDSGWDNATVFDQGFPTCGADLASYLVLQCECLADIAGRFGRREESAGWREQAQRQMAALLERYRLGDRFVSPRPGQTAASAGGSRSLLNLMPVVLGKRLPEAVRARLCAELEPDGPYLTRYGPASEPVDSPEYVEDGYWRGAVWAPTVSLLAHGLLDAGETATATEMAARWCRLCVESPGFFENYSALNGRGLRAPNTLWSAAVFMDLAAGMGFDGNGSRRAV